MAFARTVYRSSRIEKLINVLKEEKLQAIEIDQGKYPRYGFKQKWRHFLIRERLRFKNYLKGLFTFPKHSYMYKLVYKVKHDGTCENFTMKSIIGFISGFFLTYIFFMFFVLQLNFKLSTATFMCSIFGSILTIGLAFSYKVRCIVFLLLPQFFSKRGRQALIAYAFILAITGPAKNTLHNMGILSESLACGQEQLKSAVRQIVEAVKKPFYAVRDAIKTVVKTIKVIVKKIKEILLAIKRIVMAIVRVIKAAFQFLGKILSICNKELGTPFQRCMRVFEEAILDCNAKLGPIFSWLCSITYLVQSVCYIVKIFDLICMLVDFISDSIVGVVIKKIKTFVRHIKTMFYVKIKFGRSFGFETTQSKSANEVAEGILTEVQQRTEHLLAVFDFMSCATSLFFMFIIVRAWHYRYKFLTSDRFDNRFITRYFRSIDMRRAQMEKETILPLNHRERALYISVNSLRLVKNERLKLSKASVALGIITLKLSTHMLADYALYWVLMTIRYHGKFQSKVQAPNLVGLHIEGKGFVANLLRGIVNVFQPLGLNLEIDTVPCLPDPITPDYDRYIQIASLVLLCWILTFIEPYGLRLRHSVMCYYHPTRARQRSIWLYNHIIRSRSSFLKFARRQLRRKVIGSQEITKITCKEYLRANINSKWLRFCLGSDEQTACLLCGEVLRESTSFKAIRCSKPGCQGIYCEQCFTDLQNLCTVCMEPIQYGDLSDISEERDSSDEQQSERSAKKVKKRKCTISKCLKDEASESDSSDDNDFKPVMEQTLLPATDDSSVPSDSVYDSENESDHSYSYQKDKSLKEEDKQLSTSKFRDTEEQKIPNYASWEDIPSDIESHDLVEPPSTTPPGDGRQFFQLSSSRFYKKLNNKFHEFQNFIQLKQMKEAQIPIPPYTCEGRGTPTHENMSSGPESPIAHGKVEHTSSMLNYFSLNVKYDTINESTKSTSSATSPTTLSSSSSLLSTVNDAYEVDSPSPEKEGDHVNRLKDLERRKRTEEIVNSSKAKLLQMTSDEALEGIQNITKTSNTTIYSDGAIKTIAKYPQKITKYYNTIKKFNYNERVAQKTKNPISFLKKLFTKRKRSNRVNQSIDSDETLVILSPRSIDNTSQTQESRFLSSNSSSSERFLSNISLKTSPRSSQSSLMECSEGFARCGADCKVNFGSNKKRVDVDSSDSNLSDVGIFFGNTGNRHKVKLYTNIDIKRKTSRVEKGEEIKEFVGKTTTAQVAKFARQPAERDQDYSANKSGLGSSRHIKYQQLNLSRKMSESGNVSDTSSRNFNADEYANTTHNSKFVNKNRSMKHFNTDITNAYPSHIPEKFCRNCPCLKNQKRSNDETRYVKFDHNMAETQRHVKQKDECKCVCKYQSQPQPLPYKGTKKGKIYPESRILTEHCDGENVQTCKKQHCNYKDIQPPTHDLHYQDVEDQDSCCSDYSGHSEFPELVYQHTEEFLDLVNELGDTLSLRNKNRVETTIREFEYLSRQNKNLEKPIFDEETEDNCQRRTAPRETCCCDCPRRKPPKNHKVCFTKYDTEEKDVIRVTTQYSPFTECSKHCKMPKSAPCYQRTYNSRWARDYRTGKWYRMCENDGEVEEYFDDCPKSPRDPPQPPTPPPFPSSPHVSHCRRPNVRRTSKYCEEKYRRSSPTCKCCDCTKIRDTW